MSTETESKTYVFGNDSNGLTSILASMLSNKGVDPNIVALMKNNNGGFGDGNSFIWIIFLFFLMGWNRNGFGGFGGNGEGLASQINNDYGRDLLMQAINGNRTAVSELATNLNCSVGQIQSAINSVGTQVSNVGNAVGMSGQQIINAIQAGNCSIASQLAQCCCENKQLITTQGYESRLANLEQTNILGSKIDAQTNVINDKFCQLEMRELQSKLDHARDENTALKGQISNLNQNAVFAQMLNPIATSVNALQADINGIKCKLPETVNVPNPQGVFVPTCTAYQLGLGGFGLNGNGSLWG